MISLTELIRECLEMEKEAIHAYQSMQRECRETELKPFWKDMAEQEAEHVAFWKELLTLAENGKLENCFDDLDEVHQDLKSVHSQVAAALKAPDLRNATDCFLLAYRVEFWLMHPAFSALFHLMRKHTGDRSPEDAYHKHIEGLIRTFRTWMRPSAEFDLIAELLSAMWRSNQRVARQLAEIRSLQGFIPICMHCKKVRNDQGFWDKVEKYIEDHSQAQFSHGVCPDCLKEHYGEYLQDPIE